MGQLVRYCLDQKKDFAALRLDEIRNFYDGATEEIFQYFDIHKSVERRSSVGGTARDVVLRRIREIEETYGSV